MAKESESLATTNQLPNLGVPYALLPPGRRRSFLANSELIVGDSLPPMWKAREAAHHLGAVKLRAKFGHFHKIPRVSPVPGYTHLTHVLDCYARAGGRVEPPLANEVWEPSPPWQACVSVDDHENRTAQAFVMSVSLPVNHPDTGNHALFTWATPLLAHDSSLLPTMLVSRKAPGRDWRIAFVAGTLFDDERWLRDSVERPGNVAVYGAWDLHWSRDHGRTFRQMSEEQWQVLNCVPFGGRSIFAVNVEDSELTISLWEYVPGERRGTIETWTVGDHPQATPYLRSRTEDELTQILREVASAMAQERDDSGQLRVGIRTTFPPRSILRPSSWFAESRAEPVLEARAQGNWEDVPLTELLTRALARAE